MESIWGSLPKRTRTRLGLVRDLLILKEMSYDLPMERVDEFFKLQYSWMDNVVSAFKKGYINAREHSKLFSGTHVILQDAVRRTAEVY